MIAELGHFFIFLALLASFAQAGTGLWAGHARDGRFAAMARAATDVATLSILIAFFALMSAFIRSDFSVENVATNSHTLKPMLYKIAGTWGSHEGSMVLWCLISAGFGWMLAHASKGLRWDLRARAVGVQGLLTAVMMAYLAFASNPFIRLDPAPLQGAGLNPLLQDPSLAAHPPFLYLGYVGSSVVFSLAVAALLEGRVDAAWARWVRPWALASWTFLTIGIALGSYWAYYELGWGGWWFWDPVENASFMPWLLGAALLHSAIVTEKRGALASWTVLLAILTFSLSLLGTFLVRSGVLTSVHAFALDPERGFIILMILAVFTGGALALFAWRGPSLGSDRGLFAPISREGALVLNNLFLTVATATVLVGTLYPLLGEAVFKRALSVGPPYFNLTFTPLMALVLVALPIAPYLAWKRGDLVAVLQRLWVAGLITALALTLSWALMGGKALAAIGIGLGTWLVCGSVAELLDRVRFGKLPWPQVWQRVKGLQRAAWGMTLAHLGIGIFVLGAVSETSFRIEHTASLGLGESTRFAGRTVTLEAVTAEEGPNYYADRARLVVKDGRAELILSPERRFYPAARMPTTEVALRSSLGGDVYAALGDPAEINGRMAWTVRLYWNPLVIAIFGGAFLMALGGAISLTDRRLRIGAPQPAKSKNVPNAPGAEAGPGAAAGVAAE
ncbi:cytochrome c-type biogenesis protein CcmF [Candidatus Phycosocius bacilliformis]|uniref:Cytochrome c-type biogenesis protein CcmF n=1 Tax=Candidatus Phycosocius bacilliformis TaxID=1445552 RepID=A0A2P2EAW0_9PROT|nr:heme lyase CcmF/NrfE family subunit [Candidatus Phycosocius bacilliformis]GBF58200.1 cytochrome c-type biogenesis protein CcmF [Candidatus Phycosocius bacilliformis]